MVQLRCWFCMGVAAWAMLIVLPLGASEIHEAAQDGDLDNLKAIIAENPATVKEADAAGWTALHLAVQFGKIEAVKTLLAAKSDVNAVNPKGWTAIMLAVRAENLPMVKVLIEAQADLSVHDPEGHGLLGLAMQQGNAKLVLALIDAGIDLQRAEPNGATPLYTAVNADEPNMDLIKVLLDKGAEVNAGCHLRELRRGMEPGKAATPMGAAVIHGNLALVKLLAAHGADLEAPSFAFFGMGQTVPAIQSTPLAVAVSLGHKEIVEFLLAEQVNVEAEDVIKARPLHRAVIANNIEMVKLLLAAHADPNAIGLMGETPYSMTRSENLPGRVKIDPEIATLLAKAGGKWDEAQQQAVEEARAEERRPTYQTAAVQNLKALCTAQAQYNKKMDFYSDSGNALNARGTLIAADLKNAFEQFGGNDDQEKPVPKAGYIFRMLAGAGADKDSYRQEKGSHDLNSFGAIARPADKKGKQFFVSEAGTVYQHDDPGDGTFLLDAVPDLNKLDELGWKVAK